MLTITPPMRLYVQLNARYVSIVTSALRNDYEKKDGQQFHQYLQNKQSPLTSNHLT